MDGAPLPNRRASNSLESMKLRGQSLLRGLVSMARGAALWIVAWTSGTSHAALLDGLLFNPQNGHYYKLDPSALRTDEAFALGSVHGGYPATITSKQEQDYLAGILSTNGVASYWLGTRDWDAAKWITGEMHTFDSWAPGEPRMFYGWPDGVYRNGTIAIDEKGLWASSVFSNYTYSSPVRRRPLLEFQRDPRLPVPSGLVARFPFAGETGDTSGYRNESTGRSLVFVADRNGAPGQALRFESGGSLCVHYAPQLNLTNRSFSVSTFVRRNASAGAHFIVGRRGPEHTSSWDFQFKIESDRLVLRGMEPADVLVGTTVLPLNQWKHVAVTFDYASKRAALYVDGMLDREAVIPWTPSQYYPDPLVIGANDQLTGGSLRGDLDDFSIFNYALSSGEVAAAANGSTLGVTAGSGGSASASSFVGVLGATSTLSVLPPSGMEFLFWNLRDSGGGTLSSAFDPNAVFTFGSRNALVTAVFWADPDRDYSTSTSTRLARLRVYNPVSRQFDPIIPGSLAGNVRVLVHGWGRGQDQWWDAVRYNIPPTGVWWNFTWFEDFYAMADAFSVKDPGCKVLAFSWIDQNATPSNLESGVISRGRIDPMAWELSQALLAAGVNPAFSANPANKLQMLGFSHGARLAAVATKHLLGAGVRVDQLTTIDSPEGYFSWYAAGSQSNIDSVFRDLAGNALLGIIDNHVASYGAGTTSAERHVLAGHFSGTHEIKPYTASILAAASVPIGWTTAVPLAEFERVLREGTSYSGYPFRAGAGGLNKESQSSASTTAGMFTLAEGGTQTVLGTIPVLAGDNCLLFDYQFANAGDLESLEVFIDGECVVSAQSSADTPPMQNVAADISKLVPGTYSLLFRLRARGAANNSVVVSNLRALSVWNLQQIFTPTFVSPSAVKVGYLAPPGGESRVVATDDLRVPVASWVELGQGTEVSPGVFEFTDSTTTGVPRRFYRAIARP